MTASAMRVGLAIRLRLLVHDALDRDDMLEVCRLNKLADGAVAALNGGEMSLYMEWVRPWLPDSAALFTRGDA